MPSVDFYYDFSSTNSYFAAFMLPQICARSGAVMRWLPLHSAALFRGTGFDVMAMAPRKARYLWRDHARYAEATGLPFRRPSRFPIKTALALRCVLAVDGLDANDEGHARMDLSQALFRSYWERDENIADPEVLASLIRGKNSTRTRSSLLPTRRRFEKSFEKSPVRRRNAAYSVCRRSSSTRKCFGAKTGWISSNNDSSGIAEWTVRTKPSSQRNSDEL